MGDLLSTRAAEEKAEQAQKTIDAVLKSFEDKRDIYLNSLREKRGPNAANSTTEVTGGRTIMLYSQIFYTERVGANTQITDAIGDFFQAADSSIDGDDTSAQHSAVQGAKKLVSAAIDGILGDTSIGLREVESFNILFLNNAFVRIDYHFFQQNIDVVKYLSSVRSTARLVVSELAVLPIEAMEPSEISYLLSQSFDFSSYSPEEQNVALAQLGKLQTNLIQLGVLTRMLQQFLRAENDKSGASIDDIKTKTEALVILSQNVDTVLEEIQKPLDGGRSRNADLSNDDPDPVQITEVQQTYLDAGQNGESNASFFINAQEEFINSSNKIRDEIVGKTAEDEDERSKIKGIVLIKKSYEDYFDAFKKLMDDEYKNVPALARFREEHVTDFAMWWFRFIRNASEQTLADDTRYKFVSNVVFLYEEVNIPPPVIPPNPVEEDPQVGPVIPPNPVEDDPQVGPVIPPNPVEDDSQVGPVILEDEEGENETDDNRLEDAINDIFFDPDREKQIDEDGEEEPFLKTWLSTILGNEYIEGQVNGADRILEGALTWVNYDLFQNAKLARRTESGDPPTGVELRTLMNVNENRMKEGIVTYFQNEAKPAPDTKELVS